MDDMQSEYDDGVEQEPIQEKQGMSDDELHGILDRHYTDASTHQVSELKSIQEEALQRYYALPYNDGREGEQPSQITTQEFSTHISWVLPKYQAVFCSNANLFDYSPQTPQDEQYCEIASSYTNHIFFTENDGYQIVYDLAWGGEVMRLGIARVDYEEPEPSAPEVIKVTEGTLAMLEQGIQSGELEVVDRDLEIGEYLNPETGMMEQVPTGGTVTVVRTPKCGKFKVRVVPPERFLFHSTTQNLETCRYHAEQRFMFRGDIIAQFPDFEDELLEVPSYDRVNDGNDYLIEQSRLQASGQSTGYGEDLDTNDPSVDELELLDEFVFVDYNGDGKPELRNIKRVGTIILDNVEVDGTDFVVFTPERIPHVLVGRSMFDKVGDIQNANTQLKRNAFTNHAFNSNGTTVFDSTRIDPDDMQKRSIAGANIGVRGDVTGVVTNIQFADTSGQSLALKEANDREAEFRTGVSRANQGINPDAFSDTATGIELLQNAGNEQFTSRAKQMQNTLRALGKILLRKVVANQDKETSVYINGEWVPVDPSPWNVDMRCTIKAGMGAANKPQQIGVLSTIIQRQDQICLTLGDDNPYVTPDMRINAQHEFVMAAGFDNPDAYFKKATPDEIAAFMQKKAEQSQQPTPEMQKMQAEIQLKAQEQQGDMQLKMQNFQLKVQEMFEKQRLAQAKFEEETRLATQKMLANMMMGKSPPAIRSGGMVG